MQTSRSSNQTAAFKEYYRNTYANSSITFNTNTIGDIIKNQCLAANISQRKILVLYCHNEKDDFGHTVCQDWFQDNIIATLLSSERYLVAGCRITTEEDQNELIMHISGSIRDCELYSSIRSNKSTIYIFVPYLNSMLCQVYIDHGYSIDSFIEEILSINDLYADIKSNLEEEIQSDNETYTCKTFQQVMFDKLGTKDFDVFFQDQHKYLKDKIAYAFFGPPSTVAGYERKQDMFVDKAFAAILTQSDKYASANGMVIVSIIYVCCLKFTRRNDIVEVQYNDFNPVPIFILRKCHQGDKPLTLKQHDYCRVIMDNTFRVYTTWQNFLDENKYPKYVLCTPKNGEYQCDNDGNVLLDYHYTPACGVEQKVLRGLDITSTVTGLGSGGLLLVAAIPAVTLAPIAITGAIIVGAATGVYAIGRSIANLIDRDNHQQDLSFSDAEARAAYFNIAAGALGFAGAGANVVLANMARAGTNIGKGTLLTVNVLATANLTAGGVAFGNAVYDVAHGYFVDGEKPSSLTLVQLGASALFFGNSVYSFRTATSIVTEAQANTVQQMRDSLRSNRQRRTFTKMQKETIRLSNGDSSSGNAKIIRTLKNMNNIDETMAILTRNNKRFNELGIKFSAQDGHVSLNGQIVDMSTFSTAVNKAQISEIMSLPQSKIAPLATKSTFNITLSDIINGCVLISKSSSVQKAALNMLHLFRPYIQRKLVALVKGVFNINNTASVMVRNNLGYLGAHASEISCVIDFICDLARERLKLGSFGRGSIRVTQLLVNHYLCGRCVTETLVNECLSYLTTLITKKFVEKEVEASERQRIRGNRPLKRCITCWGYHH